MKSLRDLPMLRRVLRAPAPEPEPELTRFYGGDGTWHQAGHVDVEVHNGRVVAVWFRCLELPYEQHDVGQLRLNALNGHTVQPRPIVGVEVLRFDGLGR